MNLPLLPQWALAVTLFFYALRTSIKKAEELLNIRVISTFERIEKSSFQAFALGFVPSILTGSFALSVFFCFFLLSRSFRSVETCLWILMGQLAGSILILSFPNLSFLFLPELLISLSVSLIFIIKKRPIRDSLEFLTSLGIMLYAQKLMATPLLELWQFGLELSGSGGGGYVFSGPIALLLGPLLIASSFGNIRLVGDFLRELSSLGLGQETMAYTCLGAISSASIITFMLSRHFQKKTRPIVIIGALIELGQVLLGFFFLPLYLKLSFHLSSHFSDLPFIQSLILPLGCSFIVYWFSVRKLSLRALDYFQREKNETDQRGGALYLSNLYGEEISFGHDDFKRSWRKLILKIKYYEDFSFEKLKTNDFIFPPNSVKELRAEIQYHQVFIEKQMIVERGIEIQGLASALGQLDILVKNLQAFSFRMDFYSKNERAFMNEFYNRCIVPLRSSREVFWATFLDFRPRSFDLEDELQSLDQRTHRFFEEATTEIMQIRYGEVSKVCSLQKSITNDLFLLSTFLYQQKTNEVSGPYFMRPEDLDQDLRPL